MEGIVQNEAKLGGTGVCGQRRSACGASFGRKPNAQNEPNFARRGPRDCGLAIADCGLKEPGLDGVRAKRTQFQGRIVKNEPNLVRPEGRCAQQTQSRPPAEGVRRGAQPPIRSGASSMKSQSVQNEANLPGPLAAAPRGASVPARLNAGCRAGTHDPGSSPGQALRRNALRRHYERAEQSQFAGGGKWG
jgi:hypothetical protein